MIGFEQVIQHIIDIKERLGAIEANQDEIKQDIKDHIEASKETKAEVDELKVKMEKIETGVKLMKWGISSGLAAIVIKFLAACSKL